jgi:hypothetical protein
MKTVVGSDDTGRRKGVDADIAPVMQLIDKF